MRIVKVIQWILALIEAISFFVMWYAGFKDKKGGFFWAFVTYICSTFVISLLEVLD